MTDVASDPLTRIAEIRQENRGGDVSYRDIDWLCDEVLRLHSLLLRAEEERKRLREGIAEAMTSLATGPAKDGYAYSVLDSLTPEETKEARKDALREITRLSEECEGGYR